MADFSYDYGSYDYQPESDYYSQTPDQYTPDVQQWMQQTQGLGDLTGGMNAGYQNWSDWYQQPQAPQVAAPQTETPYWQQPGYEQPSAGSQPTPYSMSQPPTVGGAGGAGGEKEDWWKTLGKAAIGMGVGAGTSVLGGLISNATAPKQSQPQAAPLPTLPAPPTAATYTPEPLAPLPGTKASPLISGRPTSVKLSAGLEEAKKKPGYGGMMLY